MNEFEGEESNLISKRYVAEIIEARVEEIFDKVDSELRKIDRSGKLPAGAIVTGGGAKLPEIIEHAKKRLRLPASLGVPNQVHSALDKINDPSFSTAVGLVLWGSQATSGISRGLLGNLFSKLPNLKSVAGVVRGWVKKIIP